MRRADYLNKLYHDFYNNIIPDRVPSSRLLTPYMIGDYAGIDLKDMQADFSILNEKAKELAKLMRSDAVPFYPVSYMDPRPEKFYELLGSKQFAMSQMGVMQHPEISVMEDSEYGELADDPMKFIVEKILPRLYKNIDWSEPGKAMQAILMAKASLAEDENALMPAFMELFASGEYYEGPPMGSNASTSVPADFIADMLRGFKGFILDLRKHRSEIQETCEKLLPYLFIRGLPVAPDPEGSTVIPVHMPTYIRQKDFEEVWLPTFLKMARSYAACGVRMWLGLGGDYTRYLDILQDFPAGTIMYMDQGDLRLLKDKLGGKHILTGLFPIDVLRGGTEEEVRDTVKKYLDILAPGGGYVFDIDRAPMRLDDVKLENYIAMAEAVEEYGKYENAGQPFGQKLNNEGYVVDQSLLRLPPSKYGFDWETYKKEHPFASEALRAKMEQYDGDFRTLIFDLVI